MLIPSFAKYLSNIICFTPWIFFLVFGCGYAIQRVRAYRSGSPISVDLSDVIVLFFTLIGAVCAFLVVASALRFFNLRFDPERVAEVQIERINRDDEPALSATLILTDQQELRRGLQTLTTATYFVPNRETYSNGYRIRVRLQDEVTADSRTILVYQRANPGDRPVAVVYIFGFGSYTCPAFVEWLQHTVAPRFPPEVQLTSVHQRLYHDQPWPPNTPFQPTASRARSLLF
jgi:hypothetical protein